MFPSVNLAGSLIFEAVFYYRNSSFFFNIWFGRLSISFEIEEEIEDVFHWRLSSVETFVKFCSVN
jgi:hypothetical protein